MTALALLLSPHGMRRQNAFLVHRLAERSEIWPDDGTWSVAGLKLFSGTLLQFHPLYVNQKFVKANISHSVCRSVTKFGSVRGLANRRPIPQIW